MDLGNNVLSAVDASEASTACTTTPAPTPSVTVFCESVKFGGDYSGLRSGYFGHYIYQGLWTGGSGDDPRKVCAMSYSFPSTLTSVLHFTFCYNPSSSYCSGLLQGRGLGQVAWFGVAVVRYSRLLHVLRHRGMGGGTEDAHGRFGES